MVEILLAPGAGLVGRTLAELRLRHHYGVYPLALSRRFDTLATRFERTRLRVGASLLVEGTPEDLRRLAEDHALVDVSEPQARGFRRGRAPVAVLALAFVVLFGAFGVPPLAGLGLVAAAIVLVTRCIEADAAFAAIDIRI